MRLVVDMGNTRLKWAWTRTHQVSGENTLLQDDLGGVLTGLWSDRPAPERVLIASVAGDRANEQVAGWMRGHWGVEARFFRSQPRTLQLVNGYADPAQLGCDRWAALLGARSLTPGALSVVDCGTAITIDALTEKDYFPGGVILPGVSLTQKSLSMGTARIRENRAAFKNLLGVSTAECISSGSYVGLAGAIDRILWEIEKQLSGVTTYFTGGDAESLLPLIRRPGVIHDPDLVLRGLARVLESEA